MTKTATFVRDISKATDPESGWYGTAELFRLSEPVVTIDPFSGYVEADHVIVSGIEDADGESVAVFLADAQADLLAAFEVAEVLDTRDHAEALAQIGFEVAA